MPKPQTVVASPVASNLRHLRTTAHKRLGLDDMMSQEDVAERLGVRQSQYSKWETGRDLPRAPYVAGLALALGTTADAIVKGLARKVGDKIIVLKMSSPQTRAAKSRAAPAEPAPAASKVASSR